MHSLADFVQPLTSWLQLNPSWGLLITFLISFAESLAIVGSIIPGSLTMTAIGILAGSGVMRIDLTLCCATLGAVAGDGASYAIGYIFSDRITQMWPFNRYPYLLNYGKDFFARHGGKSVLIGRFVGPLRSIIPVIAGMLYMPKIQFLLVNFISAIGWSLLYVMPGYLIGTASSQLSTTSARRLFIFIIAILLFIWLAGKSVHWLARILNHQYNKNIHTIRRWSQDHPSLKLLFKDLDKKNTINSLTIALAFIWILCVITSILISIFAIQNSWINSFNLPISYFLQSIRAQTFDVFFIILNFVISPISLLGLLLVISGSAAYGRNWRMLGYLASLAGFTVGITWCLSSTIQIPNPTAFSNTPSHATFPVVYLTWATSLLSFVICYLNKYYRNEFVSVIRILLIIVLLLNGFATVYLGDNWMTSVLASYFIGLSISLIHWILYQQQDTPSHSIKPLIFYSICALVITVTIEYRYHFHKTLASHTSTPKHYELTEQAWWSQNNVLLPIYTTNRIGKHIGLFNIQYAGSLQHLQQQLSKHGWKKQSKAFLYSLLLRVNGEHSVDELPIMEQLYLNKKPKLTMTYLVDKKNNNLYILRLWYSNYHLNNYHEPIWLGSIVLVKKKIKLMHDAEKNLSISTLFTPILPAIKDYQTRSIVLKNDYLKSKRHAIPPELLIIKNTSDS
ncbi:MAG: VTT domain-containing protein [Legionellaceae bacterium]|nr:VTT domain-containing protein [Legionellaceae bacterium]